MGKGKKKVVFRRIRGKVRPIKVSKGYGTSALFGVGSAAALNAAAKTKSKAAFLGSLGTALGVSVMGRAHSVQKGLDHKSGAVEVKNDLVNLAAFSGVLASPILVRRGVQAGAKASKIYKGLAKRYARRHLSVVK